MALFGCKFRCQSFAKRLLREPAIVRKPLPGWRAGLMLVFFWLLLFQIYIDGIARVETSSTRDSGDKTVIIGGGVIGLATAYFLALSLKSGDSITIIDQAPLLDLRDSGDVTGIVSGQTLPLELADFEEWSFDLHREFAARYNGHERWSFHERAMHHMRIQTSSIQKERSDNDTSYVDIWSSTGFVFESLTSDPVRPASYM